MRAISSVWKSRARWSKWTSRWTRSINWSTIKKNIIGFEWFLVYVWYAWPAHLMTLDKRRWRHWTRGGLTYRMWLVLLDRWSRWQTISERAAQASPISLDWKHQVCFFQFFLCEYKWCVHSVSNGMEWNVQVLSFASIQTKLFILNYVWLHPPHGYR